MSITTSALMPFSNDNVTKVLLAVWVVTKLYLGFFIIIFFEPLNFSISINSSISAISHNSFKYSFVFWLLIVGGKGLSSFSLPYFFNKFLACWFNGIFNDSLVFSVLISIKSSLIFDLLIFAISEKRNPVKHAKQKLSFTCSRHFGKPSKFNTLNNSSSVK